MRSLNYVQKYSFSIILYFTALFFSGNSGAMNLVEMYHDVEVGDWVKLEIRKDSTQTLLLANRDDGNQTVTLEIREHDRGFLVVWRQLVVDLNQKTTILIRDKDPVTGEITEREPLQDEKIDEVLQADFTKDREEKLTQTLQIWNNEERKFEQKRKTFDCTVYRGVIDIRDTKRFVEIWYTPEVPLYPLKANVPGLSASIRLVSYGSGMSSAFDPPRKECGTRD